ncbi:hypothetical protein ACVCNR_03285 [Aquamicrobium terrae]
MSFNLPPNVILPVDEIDVRLDPAPHPFERDNAEAIAAGWAEQSAGNPALFDGTMVLLSTLTYDKGRLSGICHAVRYSTFLHWRRHSDTHGAHHAFAHAMPVSGDGALVAIRMAPHTLNAHRVYFAAGSFEPEDFVGGQVDMHRNMAREVAEETGLDLDAAQAERRHHLISTQGGVVIFRRYRFAQTAQALAAHIRGHIAADPDPEISEPIVIADSAARPAGLMPYMPALIDWHFSNV